MAIKLKYDPVGAPILASYATGVGQAVERRRKEATALGVEQQRQNLATQRDFQRNEWGMARDRARDIAAGERDDKRFKYYGAKDKAASDYRDKRDAYRDKRDADSAALRHFGTLPKPPDWATGEDRKEIVGYYDFLRKWSTAPDSDHMDPAQWEKYYDTVEKYNDAVGRLGPKPPSEATMDRRAASEGEAAAKFKSEAHALALKFFEKKKGDGRTKEYASYKDAWDAAVGILNERDRLSAPPSESPGGAAVPPSVAPGMPAGEPGSGAGGFSDPAGLLGGEGRVTKAISIVRNPDGTAVDPSLPGKTGQPEWVDPDANHTMLPIAIARNPDGTAVDPSLPGKTGQPEWVDPDASVIKEMMSSVGRKRKTTPLSAEKFGEWYKTAKSGDEAYGPDGKLYTKD